MSSADVNANRTTAAPVAGAVAMSLEVVSVPVSDVDRAKAFYMALGWREDTDIALGDSFRVVQLTPPHSGCSIAFGTNFAEALGFTSAAPGSLAPLELIVSDIETARDDLIRRGVEVGELFHLGEAGPVPGPHPERQSYQTYASFRDPDGNGWLLQEVTTRLPGRVWED